MVANAVLYTYFCFLPVNKTVGQKHVVAQSCVEWGVVSIHAIDMRNAFIILLFVVQVDRHVQLLGHGHCVVGANDKGSMEVADGIGSVSNKRCVVGSVAQVLLLVIDTSVALRVALRAVDMFAQTNAENIHHGGC
jgi:hypothetical protein